ncbi:MAG: hypothetical protein GF364_00515 [Candidatus Lokiarchaeota archaeon]|nr:hypothetical protein [Candidatus Lokiarchaeota archaeon]
MAKKKKMKFAAIGLGWIFNTQKWIFRLLKRAEIVAIVDKNEDLAKRRAKGLRVPWFTSSKQLYENEVDFDAVYIATPHHLHAPLMKEAIEHKKHIFCDKPITHTIEDAEEVIKLAKENDIKIGINYQYRYDPKVYSLVQACHENLLGKILYGKVEVPWYRDRKYYEQGKWRKYWKSAGGGTLLIHASHSIDVLLWALGNPKSIMGKYDTRLHRDLGVEVEDVGMGIIEFKSGALVQVLSTACTKPKKGIVRIEIYGENGALKYKGPWPLSYLRWYGIQRKRYRLDTDGFIVFSKILNGFIDWVWYDKKFYSTAETALTTLKTVLGIYRSSNLKKEIIIP